MSNWRVRLELADSKQRDAAFAAVALDGLSGSGALIYAYTETRHEGELLLDRLAEQLAAGGIPPMALALDEWLDDPGAWSAGEKPSSAGEVLDGVIDGLLRSP